MKILQVIPYFPSAYAFGGPVKVAYQISRELIKRGHKVVVYTTDAKDFGSRLEIDSNNTIEGMKVHRFRNLSLTLVKKLKLFITPQLVLFAREEVKKFDIIHLHEYRTFQNIVIHYYARKYDVPYILQAHGSIPRIGAWQKLKWVYDILFGYRLLRDASRVIALTPTEAEQYMSMGVPKEKITIIPNGIDLSEYAELPPKGSFKKKFNIPEDRKLILYLGRIHKTKGIDFLVKAYAHLIKETNFRDAVLVIAGPDDGYLSEVKSLAHDLGVSNSVLFTGLLSEEDKIKAYVDSDIVVNVEPFNVYGLVPLEAAACSTPVIVSKTNGISEVVSNGKFGFSIRYGDVISLASTLYRVLSDDKLAKKLGINGRNYILNNFGWDKIIGKYVQLYEEVISGRL
jgi:glycosyltransferase involved in cell wall biosynthesis